MQIKAQQITACTVSGFCFSIEKPQPFEILLERNTAFKTTLMEARVKLIPFESLKTLNRVN